jgi:hypothetical protein
MSFAAGWVIISRRRTGGRASASSAGAAHNSAEGFMAVVAILALSIVITAALFAVFGG